MLGSTVALADSSGTLDTTYTYDPFGNVTVNGATNPYQFTGRENDESIRNSFSNQRQARA